MGGGAKVIATDTEHNTHDSRLNLLHVGFSEASGRRFRCSTEKSGSGGEEASDGGKGVDRCFKRGGQKIIGRVSVGTKCKLAVALAKGGVVLACANRRQEGRGGEGDSRLL